MSTLQDISQHGEQPIIQQYFTDNPPRHKQLVDVGAFGKQLSNTWGLLNQGWKGLLIEANPKRINIIKNEFKDLKVTIINVAASLENTTSNLYINSIPGNDSLLSTWHENTKTRELIRVPTRVLDQILIEQKIPFDFDLLSIDTEGMDQPVMEHLFRKSLFRPKLIVTEVDSYQNPLSFFSNNGYTLYQITGDPRNGNLILERKKDLQS